MALIALAFICACHEPRAKSNQLRGEFAFPVVDAIETDTELDDGGPARWTMRRRVRLFDTHVSCDQLWAAIDGGTEQYALGREVIFGWMGGPGTPAAGAQYVDDAKIPCELGACNPGNVALLAGGGRALADGGFETWQCVSCSTTVIKADRTGFRGTIDFDLVTDAGVRGTIRGDINARFCARPRATSR